MIRESSFHLIFKIRQIVVVKQSQLNDYQKKTENEGGDVEETSNTSS